MEFAVTSEVLFVGERARAARLAESLDACRVRWAASPAAALVLLDERDGAYACVVADEEKQLGTVAEHWDGATLVAGDDPVESLARAVTAAVDDHDATDYPVPVNEAARLEDLRPYLREAVVGADCFERLAELAVRLVEGHVGFVGLVAERREHVVAATEGFPDALPRGRTVCTHAILDNGPFVVEDLAFDDRFADNDLLADLGARAYAGVPVRGRLGQAIGVLCVLDTVPRGFAPDDVAQLRSLAEEATDQFELRRRVADDRTSTA